MEEEFLISLRAHLDDVVERATQVLLMRDGISFSKTKKPFITVGYVVTNTTRDSAGRTNVSEIYRYEIRLFGDTHSGLMRLQNEVTDALQDPKGIPVRNLQAQLTGRNAVVELSEFTVLPNEDTANDTYNNHGIFIASFDVYRDVGTKSFTQ